MAFLRKRSTTNYRFSHCFRSAAGPRAFRGPRSEKRRSSKLSALSPEAPHGAFGDVVDGIRLKLVHLPQLAAPGFGRGSGSARSKDEAVWSKEAVKAGFISDQRHAEWKEVLQVEDPTSVCSTDEATPRKSPFFPPSHR